MGTSEQSDSHNFTEAEMVHITALFQRLAARDVAPIMIYCLESDGTTFAAFNPGFEEDIMDPLGRILQSCLELVGQRTA